MHQIYCELIFGMKMARNVCVAAFKLKIKLNIHVTDILMQHFSILVIVSVMPQECISEKYKAINC